MVFGMPYRPPLPKVSNIFGFYPFNKSSVFGANYGTNGINNGTVSGSPTATPGPYDTGINFDAGPSINTGNGYHFLSNTADFTLAFWMAFNDHTSTTERPVFGWDDINQFGLLWQYNEGGNANLHRISTRPDGGVFVFNITVSNAVEDNDWHHYLLRGDGSDVFLYIDGVQRATGAAAPRTGNQSALIIGRVTTQLGDHRMQDLGIWNTDLGAGAAKHLMSRPAFPVRYL